jgi:siderophore synthetase component
MTASRVVDATTLVAATVRVAPALPQPRPAGERYGSDDPLEHSDAYAAADAAGVESLLRCWVRETSLGPPEDGMLYVLFPAAGTTLRVPVRHWSAVGHHRFGAAVLEPSGHPADAVTVAALIALEAAASATTTPGAAYGPLEARHPGPDGPDLVARVADSVRRTATFIADRRARPEAPPHTHPFLDAEQSLLLGHPLHPTPKGREGLSEAEADVYSPELRGAFPLHWFAVDRSALAMDSAWTERGRTVPADLLLARLAGPGLGLRLPEGHAALPLHPWQANDVRLRPQVAALLDVGILRDLGPAGDDWHPTSSVRTVYRPGASAMLKLSLALRITNSRRENLRKELHRGVEAHRLLRSGLAEQWQAAFPRSGGTPVFDIVRDPAWLAVRSVPGLDVVLRHNPFGPSDDVNCVAGLTSPRPWPGAPGTELRSRLDRLVTRLAARTARPAAAVAAEWFLRYLDAVILPILWLDGEAGVALEAHQQNTLVLLDAEGWPAGGRYRDNQGYYFRESHRGALERRLPGIGVASDTFVTDAVVDERLAYYVGINNVLGLIGAFGSQRLADERVLLAAFRRFLARAAITSRSTLPARLLETPVLRCKANLLTRLQGMDELIGPVDTQSQYVTIPNPLAVTAA